MRASLLCLVIATAAGAAPADGLQSVPAPTPSSVAPDASCAQPGCLRSATKIGDYTAEALRPLLDARVTIDNGYTIWAVEYATGERTSLATIAVPYGIAVPPRGWAIAGNNHGTVGLDDACRLTGTVYGAALAGLFGARGLIGVATDYPGLGTPGVHPYLVSDSEGRAALDALRAARHLAAWQRIALSNRFAMAGLSQGGHATLAAAAMHASYAPDLDIRGFAVAAPATVFEEHWRAGFVDGPLVPFHAMLLYAWQEHYRGRSPFTRDMAPVVARAMTSQCVGVGGSTGGIGQAIGATERAQVFTPAFIKAYESGAWGDYAYVGRAFAANRIRAYKASAPLIVYQGDADTVVFEPATRALVAELRAGGVDVEYDVARGATHFDLAFGFVAAHEQRTQASIDWIRAKLDARQSR